MNPNVNKAREIFIEAVGKVPPEEWEAFVAARCGDDAKLHRHVKHLLQAHAENQADRSRDRRPISDRLEGWLLWTGPPHTAREFIMKGRVTMQAQHETVNHHAMLVRQNRPGLRCRTGLLVVLAGLGLMGFESSAAADQSSSAYYAREYLRGLQANGYQLSAISESYLGSTLPGLDFFAVVFRQYPVAVEPPEGLNPSDVLMVADDKVVALPDPETLKAVFMGLANSTSEPLDGEDLGRSYLRLTEVYSQDGFFTFSEPVVTTFVNEHGSTVMGMVEVTDGGSGAIYATLEFDEAGNLIDVNEFRTVEPGMRPI
jgi:hypothetical protein